MKFILFRLICGLGVSEAFFTYLTTPSLPSRVQLAASKDNFRNPVAAESTPAVSEVFEIMREREGGVHARGMGHYSARRPSDFELTGITSNLRHGVTCELPAREYKDSSNRLAFDGPVSHQVPDSVQFLICSLFVGPSLFASNRCFLFCTSYHTY